MQLRFGPPDIVIKEQQAVYDSELNMVEPAIRQTEHWFKSKSLSAKKNIDFEHPNKVIINEWIEKQDPIGLGILCLNKISVDIDKHGKMNC